MTKILELINIAVNSIRANKLRSSLTVLGIVVGIFSIISISTVIAMLQTSIEEGVGQLGQNTFQIQKWPAVRSGGPGSWAKYRNREDITIENYDLLKERLTGAIAIGAEQWQFGKRVKFGNEETNPNVSVAGITPDAFKTNDWVVEQGRALNETDYKMGSRVIVLGADVANSLFEFVDPIGQEVRVDGNKLTIIGVLENKGGAFGQSRGNNAMMPITTFQSFYGKRGRSVNITVMAPSAAEYQNLIDKSEGIMRTIRQVPPGEENDFDIWSNESVMAQINDITAGVRIGAYVIGGIALLAAGIGIMNIMLASVTERTKEIGIRQAIGARRSNILFQFLVEAISLSLFGGIIGIILGVAVGNLAGSFLNATAVLPLDWITIGILLCVFIGISFGTYPAYKAANLDPIEALRYE